MDFFEEYRKYQLSLLLDFHNLEVASFNLQNCAGAIGFMVERQEINLNQYFINNFKFELVNFDFAKGMYRLLKYSPDFKNNAHNFLYFEDDIFVFTSLINNRKTEYNGKQILVYTKIQEKPLSEMLPLNGKYKLTIVPGKSREQLIDYLKESNYEKEFKDKVGLHENINHLFLKHKTNFKKMDLVLTERFNLLKLHKPVFDWQKIESLAMQMRPAYLINHYDLPNIPIVLTNNCLIIKQLYESFSKQTSNLVFLRDTKKYCSYGRHIEKFIKRLKYQVGRTIREDKLLKN